MRKSHRSTEEKGERKAEQWKAGQTSGQQNGPQHKSLEPRLAILPNNERRSKEVAARKQPTEKIQPRRPKKPRKDKDGERDRKKQSPKNEQTTSIASKLVKPGHQQKGEEAQITPHQTGPDQGRAHRQAGTQRKRARTRQYREGADKAARARESTAQTEQPQQEAQEEAPSNSRRHVPRLSIPSLSGHGSIESKGPALQPDSKPKGDRPSRDRPGRHQTAKTTGIRRTTRARGNWNRQQQNTRHTDAATAQPKTAGGACTGEKHRRQKVPQPAARWPGNATSANKPTP